MDKNEIKDKLLEIIEEEMPEVDKTSIDTIDQSNRGCREDI